MTKLTLALLALLALAAPARAEAPECGGVDLTADPAIKPNFAAHADDLLNATGLLWRIEKPGVADSYLYGTMHSTSAGPMRLATQAAPYAEGARAVATELGEIDAAKKIQLGADMLKAALSPDADTFAGVLEGEDARRVEALLASKGTPAELAHHLKLWMLAIQISLPQCELEGQAKNLPEVDEYLAGVAERRHAPVVALESVKEQLDALASISPALAATLLKSAARGGALEDGGYKTLLTLYERKRPAEALAWLDAAPGLTEAERRAEADLMQRLLVGRNEVMADRAAPLLEKGGAFIAVGALHLVGKGGLIARLREIGYRVTNVW